MDFKEIKLFGRTNLSDILKEIHNSQKEKEEEIKSFINDLKPLIATTGDAVIVVPLIKAYLDVSIKNDDNLIKMAAIVQRAVSNNKGNSSEDLNMSDAEKQQLMKNVHELKVV